MLTHATLDVITSDPGSRGVAHAMRNEARVVGEKLGFKSAVDVEKRIDGAGAAVEMARLVDQPVPICDAILAPARQRARFAGVL